MYKLVGSNMLFDILGQTLENRGIKDVEEYLEPSHKHELHYSKLKNMDKAVELFDKYKGGGSRVVVIVDNDSD